MSNILRGATLTLLSVFLMTTTPHAQAEATAQEFLDKFEHADAFSEKMKAYPKTGRWADKP